VFEREEVPIPAELYNNIGVLYMTLADVTKAKEYFSRALSKLAGGSGELAVCCLYNTGRLCEEEGDVERARTFYERGLELHPAYVDADLRIAGILMAGGKFGEAEGRIKVVIEGDGRNIEARLMLGQCFLEAGKRKEAKSAFEGVLMNVESHDAYALCQCANWYMVASREEPRKKAEFMRRAFEFYDKTLKDNSGNYYAANGVAVLVAESGEKGRAKEMFEQIHSAGGGNVNAALNLAHLLTELKEPRLAVTLYESISRKYFQNRDAYVLQCISRAYYIIARVGKDFDAIQMSLKYIQMAVRVKPSDMGYWFDVALVKQQYASILNEQVAEKRGIELLEKAKAGLEVSRRVFEALGEGEGVGYSVKQAQERAYFCTEVMRKCESKIVVTKTLEKERGLRMEEVREAQVAEDERERAEEKGKVQKERERQEGIEAQRRELAMRIQEGNDDMGRVEEERGGGVKKRKKKEKVEKEAVVESSDDERDGGVKKTKLSKKYVVSSDEDL
jgi:RNA polymerase-associated protein CTR9